MIPLIKTDFSVGKSIIQCGQLVDGKENKKDQPDNLPDIIKDFGYKKVFIVEDNLGGFVPAYLEVKKAGSQLIFGWRVSIIEDGERKEDLPSSKIIIFIKSEEGWKSLVKMATLAQVDFFHKEARLDWKTLHHYWNEKELVAAIPFYDSFLHQNLCSKNQVIPNFGQIKPYVFLEDNDMIFDLVLRQKADEFAKAFSLNTVEVKSCYYRNRADLIFFQARKLMDRKVFGGGTIEVPNIEFFSSNEFCIESAAEHPFGDEKFEKEFEKPLTLFLPGIRLPEFILSDDDRQTYGIKDGTSNIEILSILAKVGFDEKVKSGEIDILKKKEYDDRINFELTTLEKTDFDPYILLVWDVLRFVRKNDLAHSAGRGSSAGSLVNFLIGITDIDPIPSGLYFERFISLSRAKTEEIDGVKYIQNAPDIDIDLGAEARERVIEYLSKKYSGRFVKLSTYNTQTTKALVKDAGKVIGGFSEDDIKIYSDEVPVKFGKVAKPEKAYEESEKFKKFADENPIVYGCVKKLQGCIKNMGSHASAYLVSYNNLDEFMPLQLGTDNEVVTSCDADVSEKMVIKLDLLGLQSVTLLDNVVKAVGIDANKIDYNSFDDIYVYLQNLETPSNLFQISGSAAAKGLNKIKPKNMSQLSDVLAICRPGSFAFLDQYSDFINGIGEKPSVHPLFDDILEESGGVMLYQESLMKMFTKIGFSLAEADDIRRITAKKKVEEIAVWEQKIYEKCKENNIDEKAGQALWGLALASADYSFNRCIFEEETIELISGDFKMLKDVNIGDQIKAFDTENNQNHYVLVLDVMKNEKEIFDFEMENGLSIRCSMEHKFLCEHDLKMHPIKEIFENNCLIKCNNKEVTKIKSFIRLGVKKTIDLEVDSKDHNFYINNLVTSNSHSYAYSRTTALSVYCKFKHPQHFFLEALKLTKEKQDPSSEISGIVQEFNYFGMKLLPPSLVKSDKDFKIEDNNIRFGLEAIKGISEKSILQVQEFINKDKANLFQVFQAALQSKMNATVMNALIEVGCLDDLTPYDRQKTALCAKIWKELTSKEQCFCIENGHNYDFDLIKMLKCYLDWVSPNGKKIGTESRLNTLRSKTSSFFEIFKQNSVNPMVSQWLFEKKLLGYCPSINLSELFDEYTNLLKVINIKYDLEEKNQLKLVGEVKCVNTGTAKKSGNKYAKITVADETGTIDCLFSGDRWVAYLEKNGEPQEDQLIYIEGSRGGSSDDPIIFINKAQIQFLHIFARISDLKRFQEKELKKS